MAGRVRAKQNLKIAGLRVVLTMLKAMALWPWKTTKESEKLQFIQRYLIHIPATFTFCLLMWVEAFNSLDLGRAGSILYMSLALTAYIVKYINMRLQWQKAYDFIHELEFNPKFDLRTAEEVHMWSQNQNYFRKVVNIYIFGSVFSGVIAFVGVLFAQDYQLGYPYWVPFEWQNPQRYWYAYAYNATGILISCLSNVSLDMLGCYMIFHMGLLYKLLGLRFKQVKRMSDNQNIIQEMTEFYEMHSNIKRMTRCCEGLISIYVLTQIILSALIICFCGYRLQKINILNDLSQFFSVLQFLSVMILEIFLPCYFANAITVNSTELLFQIYDWEWIKFSMKKRKFLILYMEFFKQPEQLRAGKFFELGLPIFTRVMNNAYGYLALLLNMDK